MGLQAKPALAGQTRCFSFGASEHDGVFSFPAAPGGAGAYLFRWLASRKHLLGCPGDNHPLISLEGLRFVRKLIARGRRQRQRGRKAPLS